MVDLAKHWKKGPFEVLAFITAIVAVGISIQQSRNDVWATKTAERAWVLVDRVLFENVGKVESTAAARVYYRNTGNSPGLRVYPYCAITFRPDQLPASLTISDMPIPKLNTPSVFVVAPVDKEQYCYADSDRAQAMTDQSDMTEQRLFVYVYGYLEYVDVFEEKHRTWYCFQYQPQTPTAAAACPIWNHAN